MTAIDARHQKIDAPLSEHSGHDVPVAARDFATGMSRGARPTGVIVGTLMVLVGVLAITVVQSVVGLSVPFEVMSALGQPLEAVAFAGAWVVIALWVVFREKRRFRTVGFFRPRQGLVQAGRGALIALGAMAIIVAVGVLSGNLVFVPSAASFSTALVAFVLIALPMYLMQGGAEELLMRGYLMQVWYRRFGRTGAVLAPTVVFTLLHSLNPGFSFMSVINLVLVGLLFTFWSLTEGALWGVIAFHGVWNWAQGCVFGAAVSGGDSVAALFPTAPTPGASDLITGGVYGFESSVVSLVLIGLMALAAFIAFLRAPKGVAASA